MLMIRFLIRPSSSASRCRQMASTWIPGTNGVPGSSTCQACSTKSLRCSSARRFFSSQKARRTFLMSTSEPREGGMSLGITLFDRQQLRLDLVQLLRAEPREQLRQLQGRRRGVDRACVLHNRARFPLPHFRRGVLLDHPHFGEEPRVDRVFRNRLADFDFPLVLAFTDRVDAREHPVGDGQQTGAAARYVLHRRIFGPGLDDGAQPLVAVVEIAEAIVLIGNALAARADPPFIGDLSDFGVEILVALPVEDRADRDPDFLGDLERGELVVGHQIGGAFLLFGQSESYAAQSLRSLSRVRVRAVFSAGAASGLPWSMFVNATRSLRGIFLAAASIMAFAITPPSWLGRDRCTDSAGTRIPLRFRRLRL